MTLLGIAPATAQVALYGVQPPAGAAFVRFVNATAGELTITPDFMAQQHISAGTDDRVSPYAVVDRVAGRTLGVAVQSGRIVTRSVVTAKPGSYTTIIVEPESGGLTVRVLQEDAQFNQLRARLALYNATPACPSGSLNLLPSGTAVLDHVTPGAVKTRIVTPVAAELQVGCSTDTDRIDLVMDSIEAGGSYSVWMMRPAGAVIAFATTDTTLPVTP